jgi:endoglucanase
MDIPTTKGAWPRAEPDLPMSRLPLSPDKPMHRRRFLHRTVMGSAGCLVGGMLNAMSAPEAQPLARKLPRWRGFNLVDKIDAAWNNRPCQEADFQWMTEWGFDFVRLPMDYQLWTDRNDPYKWDERIVEGVDQVVKFGEKYGVHVMLNLHRAPGYSDARPRQKLDLWKDEEAQKQFAFQWARFAKRYRSIPSRRLSFNLLNEPPNMAPSQYAKVMRLAIAAIRKEDPGRLIVCDGLNAGRRPAEPLAGDGVAQSTRGYDPFRLTHYRAPWVNTGSRAVPTWPLIEGGRTYDRQWLQRWIAPWQKLESQGVGVMVGEWGVFNRTPHAVVLAWMRDSLEVWKAAGWGWALWHFRGHFGPLDSERADVAYEDFRGHKLDRKMLELLRAY